MDSTNDDERRLHIEENKRKVAELLSASRALREKKDALANAEYFFNAAYKAWRRGEYSEAIELWEQSDRAGFKKADYLKAHFVLGKIHYYGLHAPKEITKGLEYLVEAADRGHHEAENVLDDIGMRCGSPYFYQNGEVHMTLAIAFNLGLGVDKSPAKAQEYLHKFRAKLSAFRERQEPDSGPRPVLEMGTTGLEPPQP